MRIKRNGEEQVKKWINEQMEDDGYNNLGKWVEEVAKKKGK